MKNVALKRDRYLLQLYVNGTTPSAMHAIANIRKICEQRLHGFYDLQILDISTRPALVEDEQIVAVPTLIKRLPLPVRRFVGDMSQTERILAALDIHER